MSDLEHFSNALASSRSGVFFEVCEAPDWLLETLGLHRIELNNPRQHILLSSETAHAKLQKHSRIETLGKMLEIIQTSLFSDKIEARYSDRPNAIEVYVMVYAQLWLVVFKATANSEILVASLYRVGRRNVFKSRIRSLVFGIALELEDVDGRS